MSTYETAQVEQLSLYAAGGESLHYESDADLYAQTKGASRGSGTRRRARWGAGSS